MCQASHLLCVPRSLHFRDRKWTDYRDVDETQKRSITHWHHRGLRDVHTL